MLRTKGEAGTGNVVEAVRHARQVQKELRMVQAMDEDELFVFAKQIQVCTTLLHSQAVTA
jgi:pyridoxal 5'-phosphate synthase pdxS subunit